VLSHVSQGDFQPGSSDIPCHLNPFDTTKGDWDMRMRTLVRILLLDKAQSGDTGAEPILSAATSAHIQNDLLSLETSVGTDTYSIFGCGDTERDTDNSQDREASASSEGDFLDSVSDAGGWFLKFLIELYFFLTPEGAITAVASVLPSPLSAAVESSTRSALPRSCWRRCRKPKTIGSRLKARGSSRTRSSSRISTALPISSRRRA
jgi:hypothetical protein